MAIYANVNIQYNSLNTRLAKNKVGKIIKKLKLFYSINVRAII